MTINKLKKELKKELLTLSDSVRFGKIENKKLHLVIDGRKVYYRVEEKGENDYVLLSGWYYPES